MVPHWDPGKALSSFSDSSSLTPEANGKMHWNQFLHEKWPTQFFRDKVVWTEELWLLLVTTCQNIRTRQAQNLQMKEELKSERNVTVWWNPDAWVLRLPLTLPPASHSIMLTLQIPLHNH